MHLKEAENAIDCTVGLETVEFLLSSPDQQLRE